MKTIRLVATDLDGTLVGQNAASEDYLQFRMLLKKLRGGFGARWAIVTGRHRTAMPQILTQFMVRGLFPDYLVFEDAKIYERKRGGHFRPFLRWNLRVTWRRSAWRRRFREQLHEWAEQIRREFPDAAECSPDTVDLWYRFPDPATAERAERLLQSEQGAGREFLVYRWGRELFVGPAAGTKGEAVRRICRRLGIGAAHVFAIGDGPNDISMLAPQVSGTAACVGNAAGQVLAAIRQFGGYPSQNPGIRGVIEALRVCVFGETAETVSQTPKNADRGLHQSVHRDTLQ